MLLKSTLSCSMGGLFRGHSKVFIWPPHAAAEHSIRRMPAVPIFVSLYGCHALTFS
jgi:hypothetical protein